MAKTQTQILHDARGKGETLTQCAARLREEANNPKPKPKRRRRKKKSEE